MPELVSSIFNSSLVSIVYDVMKKAARKKTLVSYSDIGQILDVNMENPVERDKIAYLIGEISEFEHSQGRPLLSVLVVHKNGDRKPGKGFFKLARSLDVCGQYEDEDEFFARELNRAYDVWR